MSTNLIYSPYTIVIPARLGSKRLPRKLLLTVGGQPLIWHTIQRACESTFAGNIIVATEDQEIFDVVRDFDIERVIPILTDPARSGTARIAQLVGDLSQTGCKYVVNLQGDEPLLPGAYVDDLFRLSDQDRIITLATRLKMFDFNDPNVVKVVTDFQNNALYFSRSAIPHGCPEGSLRHIGVYCYPIKFLRYFPNMQPTTYPTEKLEQLGWLQDGWTIQVSVVDDVSMGVDTANDLRKFAEKIGDLSFVVE